MSSSEKAVSFAASMIRKGEYVGKAISVAAGYYRVDRGEVQRGLASRSGKSQRGRRKPEKPVCYCQEGCGAEAVWHGTAYDGFHKSHWYKCESRGPSLPSWAGPGDGDHRVTWARYRPTATG